MNWPIDIPTQNAARAFPLPINAQKPIAQYAGGNFYYASWRRRLRPADVFPPRPSTCFPSDPIQIVAEFQAGHYLPALALTVSWGGMSRTQSKIYKYPLQQIHNALDQCAQSILRTQSIQGSWSLLTGQLEWSDVMTSKTLHFLCRALGFVFDPPVPIDGKVIRQKVWPRFKSGLPPAVSNGLNNWEGISFDAYCRYMTAVLTWAQARNWTTCQLEATIFDENK
jgi:hypothetical protein